MEPEPPKPKYRVGSIFLLCSLSFLLVVAVFVTCWSQIQPVHELHRKLKETAHRFHELCEECGATYWVTFGTLLGAAREHNIIPHDDDVDVGMLQGDVDKLYKLICSTPGVSLTRNRLAPHRFQITGARMVWLDIFVFEQVGTEVVLGGWCGRLWPARHPLASIQNRRLYDMGAFRKAGCSQVHTLRLYGPDRIEEEAQRLYGPEWYIPRVTQFTNPTMFRVTFWNDALHLLGLVLGLSAAVLLVVLTSRPKKM